MNKQAEDPMRKVFLYMTMTCDHPVAIGNGKGVFTGRVNLELVSAKTYTSGVMRVRYRPR